MFGNSDRLDLLEAQVKALADANTRLRGELEEATKYPLPSEYNYLSMLSGLLWDNPAASAMTTSAKRPTSVPLVAVVKALCEQVGYKPEWSSGSEGRLEMKPVPAKQSWAVDTLAAPKAKRKPKAKKR